MKNLLLVFVLVQMNICFGQNQDYEKTKKKIDEAIIALDDNFENEFNEKLMKQLSH